MVLRILGALVILVGMFFAFFFGVLVGQGEFDEEQAKIVGLIDQMRSRIGGLAQLLKRETPHLLDSQTEELRYKFYAEKAPNPPKSGSSGASPNYFLVTGEIGAGSLGDLKRTLESFGIGMEIKPSEKGDIKVRFGPFRSEGDALLAREKILARTKLKDVKLVKEGES